MDHEDPPLLRPIPRRPYVSTSPSAASNALSPNRTADFASQLEAKLRQSRSGGNSGLSADAADGSTTPARSRSILNLTASTLYGIYSPTERNGFLDSARSDISEPQTPWGTGAVTPSHRDGGFDFPTIKTRGKERPQTPPKPTVERSFLGQALGILALFVFGVSYGVIIEHLHDQRNMAPVKLEGLNRHSPLYLGFWGVAGVVWGLLLPWLDLVWEEKGLEGQKKSESKEQHENEETQGGVELLQMVRIIGGFIGIAFAARKLAWRSTLQASITLSLVNPALWYLFDRTRSGFAFSLFIGLTGTLALLLINPEMVPPPGAIAHEATFFNGSAGSAGNEELLAGIISYESVGVATWIASVLFCSCICFGNIGRRLTGWAK